MEKFKNDDAVICDDYGTGRVIDVSNDKNKKYPLKVEMESDNSVVFYTMDGRSVIGADITLHHSDHCWRS